jgi:hypothetical protein
VWDNCDEGDKDLVESVQLEAARVITGAIRGTSHNCLYKELGWEALSSRRERQQLRLYHKMIFQNVPQYLVDIVPPKVGHQHRYPTRNVDDQKLVEFKCRTEQYKNSFLPKVTRAWNNLPLEIRQIESLTAFKMKLLQNKPTANELYYIGDRNTNIAHARLRMGCSLLNYDLHYNIHVIDSPSCACGYQFETINHLIFDCPLYIRIRNKLFENIVQQTNIQKENVSIDMLLHGDRNFDFETNCKVYKLFQTFLQESERFGQS